MADDSALFRMAQKLRRHSLESTTRAGSGHPTTCMSAADIVSVLFFDEMRWDPSDPSGRGADVFVLSKGHAAPILWAALKEAYYGEHADALLVVEYELLAQAPEKVLRLIYEFIGEPWFGHDFENVQYDAPEFDEALGVTVHVAPLAVLRRGLRPGAAASYPVHLARGVAMVRGIARRVGAQLIHTNMEVLFEGGLAARTLGALLFGVRPHDALVLTVTVTVLLTTALIAALSPARRAARTDPATALRGE